MWFKRLRWALLNGILGAFVWFGVVQGHSGLGNVVVFYSWFCVVLAVVGAGVLFLGVATNALSPLPPFSVPRWVDIGFDLTITGAMVWSGWMFTAMAYLLGNLGCHFIHMLWTEVTGGNS